MVESRFGQLLVRRNVGIRNDGDVNLQFSRRRVVLAEQRWVDCEEGLSAKQTVANISFTTASLSTTSVGEATSNAPKEESGRGHSSKSGRGESELSGALRRPGEPFERRAVSPSCQQKQKKVLWRPSLKIGNLSSLVLVVANRKGA